MRRKILIQQILMVVEGLFFFCGNYGGGWNNQSYDEELVCSQGMDENMIVIDEFDMCCVLVVREIHM